MPNFGNKNPKETLIIFIHNPTTSFHSFHSYYENIHNNTDTDTNPSCPSKSKQNVGGWKEVETLPLSQFKVPLQCANTSLFLQWML